MRKNAEVVDQEQSAPPTDHVFPVKPIFESQRHEMPDIQDFSGAAANDGRAQHAGLIAADPDVEVVFDNVDDLIHGEPDGAT